MHKFAFPQSRILVALFLACGLVPAVHGQVATTTQLTIPVPTIAVGVPTLLTATVTDVASHSVLLGTVTFYDGSRLLGSAQIVSGSSGAYPQGTANLKTASLSLGANSITAVFAGTASDAKSASSAKTVTVTGENPTTTTLSGSVTGTEFWLTAALRASGVGTPTGDVDFSHISNGVPIATIDTKSLTEVKWTPDLSVSSTAALSGTLPTGDATDAIAVGDFNGDGLADLATIYQNSGGNYDIGILLGEGNGSFQSPLPHPLSGTSLPSVYTADFNNDGRLDLAVVDSGDGKIGVLLGNGDGTFETKIEYGSDGNSNAPEFAYIGDLNRDGNADVVFSFEQFTEGTFAVKLAVLLGNGDGTFQTQATYTVAGDTSGNSQIAGGDVNGDGIVDLVMGGSNGLYVLLGKGDGTFQPALTSTLGDNFNPYITLADVNGDGKLDMVFSCSTFSGSAIGVALGNGDGTFGTAKNYSFTGNIGGKPTVVDINQDGKLDLVVEVTTATAYNRDSSDSMRLLLGKGDGTFESAVIYPQDGDLDDLIYQTGPYSGPVVGGDFNGDGRSDLVTTNILNNAVNTILNVQTTSMQIARDGLGPNMTTVQASYDGDADFAESASNMLLLSTNGVDYGGGFAGAGTALHLNNGSAVSGGNLQLTSGTLNHATSAFSATPLDIQQFVTDFTFQLSKSAAGGLVFVIQGVGPSAVGSSGGGLGYQGIAKSIAVKFDTYNNCNGDFDSTGLSFDSRSLVQGCDPVSDGNVDLRSGDPFQAHVTYDGTYLALTLTDTVTSAKWGVSWLADIPHWVGGSTAYVGFTAASGGQSSTAAVHEWKYLAETPPPHFPSSNIYFDNPIAKMGFANTANLVFNKSAAAVRNALAYEQPIWLTPNAANQAGSVFYATPQNVQAFTTDFQFGIGTGNTVEADGMTFTIQNDGPQALGGPGGALGYKNIPKSVAIKFDFYDNSGEGDSSTGLYLDGASPTVPAVDMSASGLTLAGARGSFGAHITYDGTTLTLKITSLGQSSHTFTHSWAVDIPAAVGGTTAYVGFTAGTGGMTSQDSVVSWTYLPGVF